MSVKIIKFTAFCMAVRISDKLLTLESNANRDDATEHNQKDAKTDYCNDVTTMKA